MPQLEPNPRAQGLPGLDELAGPEFTSAVLAAAPAVILVLDDVGRVVHYNEFMERLSGRPLAEARGCDWFDEFLVDDERQATREFFARTLHAGPVQANRNFMRVREGAPRLIEWYDQKVRHAGSARFVVAVGIDITERDAAARAQAELCRRFELFDGAVDEVFLLISPTRDRILYASAALERVVGIPRSAAQADFRVLLDRVYPEDRALVSAVFEADTIVSGRAYEFRMMMPDGSVRWVLSRLTVLDAKSELPGAIVSISMDITARRKAETRLQKLTQELEQRVLDRTAGLEFERRHLQDILDGLAQHVMILDPQGHVRQLNAVTARGASRLATGVLGEHVERLPGIVYSERSVPELRAALALAQQGQPARADIETRTVNGCAAVTDTSFSPIFDDAGEVVEIVTTGVDVTQRRADEQHLRDSLAQLAIKEGRLAAAQRIADIGDWDWNILTNDLHWSDQIYRIFGWEVEPTPTTYDAFIAAVHESDRAAVIAAIDHALATGEHYQIEHRIVRPDGEIRHIMENGEVTRDAENRPIRMRGTAQDITRQKAVEAQLRCSLEEKDALVHELHHRVKNNLQVVTSLLYLQSLAASPDASAVLDECRGRIRSMALVHEHLCLSREVSRIDMADFIFKLGEEMTHVFAHRRVGIRVLGGGMHLNIEHAAPVALLVNEVLTNALKYAYPNAEPGAEVRVIVEPSSLEIADDGVGLPAGFERENVDSLGIRLVRSLARQIGAVLEIKSEKGARIKLALPPLQDSTDPRMT